MPTNTSRNREVAQSLHRKVKDFHAPDSLTAEWMRVRFPIRFSVKRLDGTGDGQGEAAGTSGGQ
jgi:hypothetical protein